jgi:hypothetical protein
MIKSSLYIALLLFLISTASYAQVIKVNLDTSRCYGITELRDIASRINDADKCEELLENSNAKIAVKDTVIALKDKELSLQSSEIVLQKSIINNQNTEIQSLTIKFDDEVKRHKFTKLGWAATGVILSALTFFSFTR